MGDTPSKKEVIAQLAEKFPNAAKFEISYAGSGDSFDSFYSLDAVDADGKNIQDYERRESEFLSITEDYIFELFERSGNPDFNNDGSEGTVTFDMVNKAVILHNYWIIHSTESSGEEVY